MLKTQREFNFLETKSSLTKFDLHNKTLDEFFLGRESRVLLLSTEEAVILRLTQYCLAN